MSVRTERLDPATRFVRSLEGEYFLLREAAIAVGTSQFVLRKMIQDGNLDCSPSKYAQFGKTKIYLYTQRDIDSIIRHIAEAHKVYDHNGPARRPGRPVKFNQKERRERARLYSKAWYWRNRAKVLAESGEIEKSDKAMLRALQIDKELKGAD